MYDIKTDYDEAKDMIARMAKLSRCLDAIDGKYLKVLPPAPATCIKHQEQTAKRRQAAMRIVNPDAKRPIKLGKNGPSERARATGRKRNSLRLSSCIFPARPFARTEIKSRND